MVKNGAHATPNRLLKAARQERGWTQQQVADRIGAPLALNVSRWETGATFPSAYYVEQLCHVFGKSIRELGLSRLDGEMREETLPTSGPVEQTQALRYREHTESTESASEPTSQRSHRAALLNLRSQTPPLPLTPLIGREREADAVCGLLQRAEVRLVTLTGAGGIGKTRLGLRVATQLRAHFADGISFVSLSALSDPALVIPTVALGLGLEDNTHQSLLDLLGEALGDKHLLLLLDNFERLIVAAPQVAGLLARCPRLAILATSRAVLRIQGEYEFPVSPLALPRREPLPACEALAQYAAVALFVCRAQAVRPEFRLTPTNASTIAEICLRLDGLPLALELAAARLKLLTPQELLKRLAHRLSLLTDGPQDLPERQQTLRNTITWSYQLLHAQEQQLFERLSVFVGGCTLEAVEAVCARAGADGEVRCLLEGVTSLIGKSLLQTIQQEGEESRLYLLETIREFGLECLAARGELEATRCAHARHYLALAEEAAWKLRGRQQVEWVGRLEREHDNLRAALQWALEQRECGHGLEMALRLGAALGEFWRLRGHVREGRAYLERALERSEGVEVTVRASAMIAAGFLADAQGDFAQAEAWCQESLAVYRKLGLTSGIALALLRLGDVAMKRGTNAEASTRLEAALTCFREEGDAQGISDALLFLGNVAINQGEHIRACELLEESLTVARKAGNISSVASALNLLARATFFQGDVARALARCEESLACARRVDYKECVMLALVLRGLIALAQGEIPLARSLLEESLALSRMQAWREHMAWAVYGLGWCAFVQHDYTTALSRFERGLVLCRALGNLTFTAFYLEGLASVASAQEQPAWAARLWGAAAMVRQTIQAPVPPIMQPAYEQLVGQVQAQLGEIAFTELWDAGRIMTLDQVMGDTVLEWTVWAVKSGSTDGEESEDPCPIQ